MAANPIETLLQSLKGGTKTALDQAGYGAGRGGFVAPMAPMASPEALAPTASVAPQLSPTAKYIADMQALMSGGVGKLSTGEKLGAIGQILQAAGSRGRVDPGAVIQNVRQQQMQKLNAQYQIAQLQQGMQEEAAQKAAIEEYSQLLTDSERAALKGLPLAKRADKIAEIAFREKRVQQISRDDQGRTRIIYSNGEDQIANWSLPPKTKYENLGDKLVLINEDTGAPVLDENGKQRTLAVNMNPYQAANYGLALKREARIASGGGEGGGGGGDLPRPNVQLFNGKPTLMQWNKRTQKYVPFKQPGISAPTKADMAITGLSPATQGLLGQSLTVE